MPWNNFGLTSDKIVSMYPGVVVEDMQGSAVVDEAITRAVNDVLDLMPERIYRLFTERVELEIMAGPAGGAEGGYTLGLGKLAPVLVASMRAYEQAMDERFIRPLNIPVYLEDNYTQNVSLGGTNNSVATFTPGTVQKNNFYLITYKVDVDTLVSFPGASRIAQYRTAYELGDKLFTQATENWALVEEYKAISDGLFDDLKAGKIIFDEIRRLKFAREIMPATAEMSVHKKFRA